MRGMVALVQTTAMLAVCVALCAANTGCGYIADKDRIKVARIGDTYITRGDFARILRDMPDPERPVIQTKGDLKRALDNYINDQIKLDVAYELEAENKISVPREAARAVYLREHPDFRMLEHITDPGVVGISAADFDVLKEEVELGIDRAMKKMLGEEAIGYLVKQHLQDGTITIKEEQLVEEYELRRNELKNLEAVRFIALRFPITEAGAERMAAEVRRRLDAGENIKDVAKEYAQISQEFVLQGGYENDPSVIELRSFWESASGAQPGTIIGPLFVEEHELMFTGPDGRMLVHKLPAAFMTLQIVDYRPESPKTIEQAEQELLPFILYGAVMSQLRQEKNVEVYDDKLPDPSYIWQAL